MNRLGVCLLSLVMGGCAALTNPVADGIPVRYLPPEVLGESKCACVPVPLTFLQHHSEEVYRLAPGDVLGVWIEGVLGDRALAAPVHTSPPVQVRDQRRLPPSWGYPVPVREDGTIALPMVSPIQAQGRTLIEVETAIRQLFVKERKILQPENEHVSVTLLQPRQIHVLVLRQEAATFAQGAVGLLTTSKRGSGFSIDLPIGENDVLHALTVTGGLPGVDAYDEVIVQRGCFQDKESGEALRRQLDAPGNNPPPSVTSTSCVRIPLRWKPDEKLPFGPEDVILRNGDIVLLRPRYEEVFFTGGLLPSGEHMLPRDRDLDVIEAVTSVRGPLINGAFANNNLSGNLILPGIGFDNPSLLVIVRRLPNGGQLPIRVDLNQALRDPRERILVRPGDLLILQEMPNAALARFTGSTLLNFNLAWIPFHSTSLVGVGDVSALQQSLGRITVGSFTNTIHP